MFHEGVATKIFEVVAITFAWDGVQTTKKRLRYPLRDVDTQLQVLPSDLFGCSIFKG